MITGHLRDFAVQPLTGFSPLLEFVPSKEAVTPDGILVSRAIPADTLFPDGSFYVWLEVTDGLPADVFFRPRVSWYKDVPGRGRVVQADQFPDVRIYVPAGGGDLKDLIEVPPITGMVWIGSMVPPEASPGDLQYDPNDGVGGLYRIGKNMERTFITSIRGLPGQDGKQGPPGPASPMAVSEDHAIASTIQTPGTITNSLLRLGKIMFKGTSIGMAVGTSNPATKGYPQRMEYWLGQMIPDIDVEVINFSVSGQTSRDMRATLWDELTVTRPQIVVIELPINDVALTKNLTVQETIDNIRAMAGMCRLHGAQLMILTHQMLNPAQANQPNLHTQATQARATQNRASLLDMVHELPGVQVVDIFKGLQHQVNVLADGIHPNDKGADQWGYMIAEMIVRSQNGIRYQTYWEDFFERTSNTAMGGGWAPWFSSVWGTDGHSAYNVTGGDGVIVHRLVAEADVDFTVELAAITGLIDGGILVRSSGGSDGYLATYQQSGGATVLVLYYLAGSGATELTRSLPLIAAPGTLLTLNASGNNLLAMHNEEPVLSWVNTGYPTNKLVGLRRSANAAIRFGAAYARF